MPKTEEKNCNTDFQKRMQKIIEIKSKLLHRLSINSAIVIESLKTNEFCSVAF